MSEDRVADACIRPGAVLDRIQVTHRAGAHLEQPDGKQRTEPDQEGAPVLRHDAVVDRVADQERRRDRAHLPEQAGQSGAEDPASL